MRKRGFVRRGVLALVVALVFSFQFAAVVGAAPPDPYPDLHDDGILYIPRWGDTLTGISRWSGVSVETLVRINSIADPDLIRAGVGIYVPAVFPKYCPQCRPVSTDIRWTNFSDGWQPSSVDLPCMSTWGEYSYQSWAPYSGCKYFGHPWYCYCSSKVVDEMYCDFNKDGDADEEYPHPDDLCWWKECWTEACGGCWWGGAQHMMAVRIPARFCGGGASCPTSGTHCTFIKVWAARRAAMWAPLCLVHEGRGGLIQ